MVRTDAQGAEGRRFVWPPRPIDAVPGRGAETPMIRPAPPTSPALSRPSPIPPSPRLEVSPLRALIRAVEREWLGLEKPPLAERIAAARWTADAPARYCPRCGASAGP